MSLKDWTPRRKIAAQLIAAAVGLAVTFGPRIGVVLSEEEKRSLEAFLATAVLLITVGYLTPGEKLASSKAEKAAEPSADEPPVEF